MNQQDFDRQVNRIRDCFGDKSYSDERTKLLWCQVNDLPAKWLERSVDHFIGSRPTQQPPLPADFAQLARDERERQWERSKGSRAKEAEAFWTDPPEGFIKRFTGIKL